MRAHLIVFGMAIVIPVLVFAGLLFGEIQGIERQRTESLAHGVAQNVVSDVDRELAAYISILRALAPSAALRQGDIAAFREWAVELARDVDAVIVLRNTDGTTLARTDADNGAQERPAPPRSRPRPATSELKAQVSNLVTDATTTSLVVAVESPVSWAGSSASLSVLVKPERLAFIINDETIPDDWAVELQDGAGRLIARSRMAANLVGTQAPGAVVQGRSPADGASMWNVRDLEGRKVLAVYEKINSADWTIGVMAPTRALQSSMRRSFAILTVAGGTLLALSLSLALYFGGRIAAPIRQVAGAARALTDGVAPLLPQSNVREANELGRALTEASEALRERTLELERTHGELESLTQASPIGIGLFKDDGSAIRMNPTLEELQTPLGDGPVQGLWSAFSALLAEVSASGKGAFTREITLGEGDAQRFFLASAFPVGCPQASNRAIGVTMDEITGRKRAEAELIESHARTRRLLDANFFGLMIVSDGRITEANDVLLGMLGHTQSVLADGGLPVADITPPEFQPLDERAMQDVAEAGVCKAYEKDMLRADGRRVPVLVGYARLEQRPLTAICFVLDLTEQRQRETQRKYLMRELTHRTKNLLSVVQAMALQTAKTGVSQDRSGSNGDRTGGSLDDFHERFAARLQGLAGSHDLLVQENWSGASMSELVRSQLGHYADSVGQQIHLSGPRLLLEPEAAQNLGMALHELSTNAAKYGSLSVAEGQVHIDWRIEPQEDGPPRFVVEWRESGGPRVEPPRRKGFGHVVMARIAARALDGQVEMTFAPEGLWWRLTAPATLATMLDGDG